MSNALRTLVPIRLSASDSPRSSESFPGLLAALRPIRRISSQLADEAVLLRRFTYKNKNQHKGCGWWRKIVEVDRFASRVTEELDGLLLQFGAEESVRRRIAGESADGVVGASRGKERMKVLERLPNPSLKDCCVYPDRVFS